MTERTPTPLAADALAALFGPTPGHVETPGPGPIMFAHIAPEARDLLDTIMAAWEAEPPPANPNGAPASIYQFAYWLLRYSGLINAPLQVAAPQVAATLAAQTAEIAALRAELAREQEDGRLLLESLSTRDGDVVDLNKEVTTSWEEITRLRTEAAALYDEARALRDMLFAGGMRWAGPPSPYPDNPFRDALDTKGE